MPLRVIDVKERLSALMREDGSDKIRRGDDYRVKMRNASRAYAPAKCDSR